MHSLTVSKSATNKINKLNENQSVKQMLRVKVEGGGCNGLKYKIDLTDTQKKEDFIFTKNGAKIVIDKTSMKYLKNSELDYVEDLGGASFVIHNPNFSSRCGCGSSFSYNQ